MTLQELETCIMSHFPTTNEFQNWLNCTIWPRYRMIANQREQARMADRENQRRMAKVDDEYNLLVVREAQLFPQARHRHTGLPLTYSQLDRLKIDERYWFINEDGTWQLKEVRKLGRSKDHKPVDGVAPRECPFGADPWPGYRTKHLWPEK
jgi:hypothetical protein